MRIAVLDDYQDVARSYADWDGLDVEVFTEHVADVDELVAALEPFDVIAAMRERTRFPREVITRLPNLKLLVTTGMRNASIDVEAASDHGVVVAGTGSGGGWGATSELAWGLIFALLRDIPGQDRQVRTGGWQTGVGVELGGKTLGLLGLGRLGSQVADVARAFGMNVIAWSSNLTEQRAAEAGARLVGKDELFAESDVLSVHLVLGERSRGLVGADELAMMKPTAFLINTSRGPIVDEAALRAALHEGRIAGAGIDVYGTEPLPVDDPWRSTPRTVLTPHIGYVTDDTYEAFFTETVENIRAFAEGSPIRVLNGG
ncbi:D-2-hydroxyacid dehydrogenase family protein [Saccharopolyspora dendranthemae]|uniref:Lactate dehydrogenase-like 2-hydroxyacid dehydrogenase n=1 Tax=Saccharopolyspora dendranthemae TaxID=1181886 RepID=A0A561VAH6_9PSEU|nr:D-2-hydroxyacid dehydrogenase family protein [Saccharopolyspora dendranthemae]TWG08625.1 lactate dehydrogenase-like 2-hydroxyacid dehydrogenase [Saccharopolyspora dendranthemae]